MPYSYTYMGAGATTSSTGGWSMCDYSQGTEAYQGTTTTTYYNGSTMTYSFETDMGTWVTYTFDGCEIEPTPEQLERARINQHKRDLADDRSKNSLLRMLSRWQKWFFNAYNAVPVILEDKIYIIRGTSRMLVLNKGTYEIEKEVCVHGRSDVPKYDHHIALMMHLLANKDYLLDKGNDNPPSDRCKEIFSPEKMKRFFESNIIMEKVAA